MRSRTPASETEATRVIAICGNPNCGKTTLFNAVTGLNQQVGNYPGVTVERVSGQFAAVPGSPDRYTLLDIPGTYSLSAFSPDEYIACSALTGSIRGESAPDAIICVVDATQLERGLYFLQQVLEIGRPVVAAINMIDLAAREGMTIDYARLSDLLGGIPVVPVVGSRGTGIDELKRVAVEIAKRPTVPEPATYDPATEAALDHLRVLANGRYRSRAELVRVLLDVDGPAEHEFLRHCAPDGRQVLHDSRARIKSEVGGLAAAETNVLTARAQKIFDEVVTATEDRPPTLSARIDRYLLHPILGPIVLIVTMVLVFQSIFSWAEPFMDLIDRLFGSLASLVQASMVEGPLRSLITDGIIGGVGSVLVFIPQIVILFLFIAFLEDSGYMARAAFLVDRMFRWCGLSGKSFIPMLSSFACAVPGILATRTIEDRKLRFITIMVAPLMTCSARLPVYAIMIAAFIPYRSYLGIFNLQGAVLTMLYLMGIIVAVLVSFVLQRVVFKAERGTFLMEMPSYKLPTLRSVFIRVINRVKAFVVRAGTVILAITIVIWALSYFPRSGTIVHEYAARTEATNLQFNERLTALTTQVETLTPPNRQADMAEIEDNMAAAKTSDDLTAIRDLSLAAHPELADPIAAAYQHRELEFDRQGALDGLANARAGALLRDSYFARMGQALQPVFAPLGWDWRITMATLSAFPAREVIIATLGTIFNLGSDVSETDMTMIERLRQAQWESGPKAGQPLFSPAVALSIMIFFALCCQCGATLVTIRKETQSWLYPAAVFTYMTVLAYLLGIAAYQIFSRVWY